MKAKVNAFYRSVSLSIDNQELATIFFDYTDEWESREINGKMYDIPHLKAAERTLAASVQDQ